MNLNDPGFKHPKAACLNATPVYFSERGDATWVKRAKKICQTCPVLEECKQYVLRASRDTMVYGVWGGMSSSQIKAYRKKHNAEKWAMAEVA